METVIAITTTTVTDPYATFAGVGQAKSARQSRLGKVGQANQ